jgi:tetratricopeptide (TPR) repeat protein
LKPSKPLYRRNRGWCYYRLQQYQLAVTDFTTAIELEPGNAENYRARAEARFKIQQWKGVVADFSAAIDLEPKYAMNYRCRAYGYSALREWKQAIADLTAAINLEPKNAKSYYERATVFSKLEAWDKVIDDLNRTLALEPENMTALHCRCWTYSRNREWDKAVADCSQMTKIAPNNPATQEMQEYIMKNYVMRNEPPPTVNSGNADAIRSLSGFLSGQSSSVADWSAWKPGLPSADVLCDIGKRLAASRQWEQAIQLFGKAIRTDENHSAALTERAWLRCTCPDPKFRDAKLAFADARRACELTDWKDPVALETLAACYAENGQFDEAVKWQGYVARHFADYAKRCDGVSVRLKLYRERKPAPWEK